MHGIQQPVTHTTRHRSAMLRLEITAYSKGTPSPEHIITASLRVDGSGLSVIFLVIGRAGAFWRKQALGARSPSPTTEEPTAARPAKATTATPWPKTEIVTAGRSLLRPRPLAPAVPPAPGDQPGAVGLHGERGRAAGLRGRGGGRDELVQLCDVPEPVKALCASTYIRLPAMID